MIKVERRHGEGIDAFVRRFSKKCEKEGLSSEIHQRNSRNFDWQKAKKNKRSRKPKPFMEKVGNF